MFCSEEKFDDLLTAANSILDDDEDERDGFLDLISAIEGTDLMREKFDNLLTTVETIPDDQNKYFKFRALFWAIKGTELMDAFSSRKNWISVSG